MLEKIFLKKEIKKWLDSDVITKEQAINILDIYGLSYEKNEKNFSIFSILGYLLLGISIIILIANNWNNISPTIRVFSLISITAAIQIFAYIRLIRHNNSNLFFLGNLIFGASIILIAQIYHISTYTPNGVLLWALGSFMIAIFINNKWVNLQSLLLATLWCLLELENSYPYWFLIFLIISVFILYRHQENRYFFNLFLLNLMWFLPYTLHYFIFDSYVFREDFYLSYALFTTYILFLFLNLILKNRANFYLDSANSIIIKTLYLFSFLFISEYFYDKLVVNFLEYNTIFYALISIILVLTYLVKEKKYFMYTALFIALVFLVKVANLGYFSGIFIFINFILFIFYSFMVYRGIMENNLDLYRLGIASILIFIFIHYFSLISKDYVTTSIFFFICSIAMLLFVRFFKKIKRI